MPVRVAEMVSDLLAPAVLGPSVTISAPAGAAEDEAQDPPRNGLREGASNRRTEEVLQGTTADLIKECRQRQPTNYPIWLDRRLLAGLGVPLACAVCFSISSAKWRSGVHDRAEWAEAQNFQEEKFREDMRAEAALIAQYQAPFLELVAHGLFADARRQVWMDTTLEAMSAAGVANVELALLPAQRVPPDPIAPPNQVDAFANPMTLHFSLAHGAQLFTLLEILRAQTPRSFSVDFCQLERTSPPGKPAAAPANIRAECRLTWFNLILSSVPERT